MNHDDRSCARRERFTQGVRRHEQRLIADIGEAGNSARPHNRRGRGDEGVRRYDHLVSRVYLQRGEG
jgi:hypothetical protein